jgi:hypothetical protein
MKKTVWLLVVLMVACGGEDSGVGKATETLCSIAEQTDGSKLITCDDGTSAVLRDGVDGLAGRDGVDGVDGVNGRDGVDGMDGLPGPIGPVGPPSIDFCPSGVVDGGYTINNFAEALAIANCRIVTGDLNIRTVGFQSLAFPNLVSVQGLLNIEGSTSRNGDLINLSMPALVTVGSMRVVSTSLRMLDLPSLLRAPAINWSGNPQLKTISAPMLDSSPSSFQIAGNAVLVDVMLPLLINGPVSNAFSVSGNPLLPACQAQDLLDQLLVAPPSSDITGNLGTCP